MKYILVAFCGAFLICCGTTVGVDYDKQIDFGNYTTYNFYPSLDSGLNALDDKRIIRATDSLLQLRGFVKSDTPQLYINFFAKEQLTNSRNTLGVGIGSGGRNGGVGISGGSPIGGKVIEQEFTLDFIDVLKDDLVWQAVAESDYKEKAGPQQKEKHYVSILNKIFSKYPPKQK